MAPYSQVQIRYPLLKGALNAYIGLTLWSTTGDYRMPETSDCYEDVEYEQFETHHWQVDIPLTWNRNAFMDPICRGMSREFSWSVEMDNRENSPTRQTHAP